VGSHDPARRFTVWIDHLAEQAHRCPLDQGRRPLYWSVSTMLARISVSVR
jgi:hypothetical protein